MPTYDLRLETDSRVPHDVLLEHLAACLDSLLNVNGPYSLRLAKVEEGKN